MLVKRAFLYKEFLLYLAILSAGLTIVFSRPILEFIARLWDIRICWANLRKYFFFLLKEDACVWLWAEEEVIGKGLVEETVQGPRDMSEGRCCCR